MARDRVKLEGTQVNDWLIEEYIGNMQYKCKCKCGNTCIVSSRNLKNGTSTRCRQCYYREKQDKFIGKTFGNWKVLKYAGDKKQLCQCLKCGKTFEVYTESLVNGSSLQCTHCKSSNRKDTDNLEGKTFGKWKVDKYLGYNKYECTCECGTTEIILGNNLKVGHTTQCKKCSNRELIVLQNNTFGDLVAKEYIGDGKWRCLCSCGRNEVIHGYYLRNGQRTMCKACSDNGSSSDTEKQILAMFSNAEAKNRSILGNKEIDIYIPDKSTGIEFNGNYWHSSRFKDKHYHQNKSKECIHKGIRLIHLFEYEWKDERVRSILECMLRNIESDTRTKLYARNLTIKAVDVEERKSFLEDNHLQGDTASKINIGLYNKEELVALMTFGTPRFDNSSDTFELIRYCVKKDSIVVGGAEKLFKYFCRTYKFKSIISYCDISKFKGDIYYKLGFNLCAITEPNYVWVKNDNVLKRYQTQKQKLLERGLGTEDETEDIIMERLGYLKVYDSGNFKFKYEKK